MQTMVENLWPWATTFGMVIFLWLLSTAEHYPVETLFKTLMLYEEGTDYDRHNDEHNEQRASHVSTIHMV